MSDLRLNIIINAITDGLRRGLDETKSLTEQLREKLKQALSDPATAGPLITVLRLAQNQFLALRASGVNALNAIKIAGIDSLEQIHQIRKDTDELRQSFIKFGASVVTTGLQAMRGVRFETAFSDVKKVVDGTQEQIESLERSLKNMALVVSVPLDELAKIAAFGGQLGLPFDEIEQFTLLVAKMSTAFGILPEEAAQSIGNLRNVFGLSIVELERFGDQINTIADNANTSERALLNVLDRAGGTAQRFGLLRGETVALSAAMLSMGREPEVVATSMFNMLSSLQNATGQTDEFKRALSALGLDAKQFERDVQAHPVKALDDFLQRIHKLNTAGQGSVIGAMFGKGSDSAAIGDLIAKLEEYHRLVGLASQDELFTGSMAKTFEEREKTVEGALSRLKNAISVMSINATALFLPAIRFSADALRDLAAATAKAIEQYPNLAAFTRIALIFSTLGGAFRLFGLAVTTLMPGIVAAIRSAVGILAVASGSGAMAVLRAGFTGLASVLTSIFGAAIGRAIVGVGALTLGLNGLSAALGFLGSSFVAVLSNPLTAFLAGITLIGVRIASTGSAIGRLAASVQLLGPIFLRLIGGPIGLMISALTFLGIKFIEVKDKLVEFGGINTTITEIIGASWRIVTRLFGDVAAWISQKLDQVGGYLSNLVGVDGKTWAAIKTHWTDFVSASGRLLLNLVNSFIATFGTINSTALFGIQAFFDLMKNGLSRTVDVAKAAGRDIANALNGDFSGQNTVAAFKSGVDSQLSILTSAKNKIAAVAKENFSTDYVGVLADSLKHSVGTVKQAIVDEINAGHAKPKQSAAKEQRNSGTGTGIIDGEFISNGPGHTKKAKEKTQPVESEMHGFEQGLTERKIAFERENTLREFSKKEEKKYWDTIIATYHGNSKTLADLKKKSSDLDLQIIREAAKEKEGLQKESFEAEHAAALDALDEKEVASQQELDLGTITQEQHLANLRNFAAERLAIEQKLLDDKRRLLGDDALALAQNLHEKEALTRAGAAKIQSIDNQDALARKEHFKQMFAPLENALDQSVNGVLTGQQTIKNAVKNAGQSIVLSYAATFIKTRVMAAAEWAWEAAGFAGKEAKKKAIENASFIWEGLLWAKKKAAMAAQWAWDVLGFGTAESTKTGIKVVNEGVQTGAAVGADIIQTTSKIAAEETKQTVTAKTASKSIMAKAYDAAAGVYSSLSDIPYVGWILAPIAAAATFITVAGWASMVGSAKGGEWQVGEDGSPYILHKDESVLPAGVAEGWRKVVSIVNTHVDDAGTGKKLSPAAEINQLFATGQLKPLTLPEFALNLTRDSQTTANGLAKDRVKADKERLRNPAAGGTKSGDNHIHIHGIALAPEEFFRKNSRHVISAAREEVRKFNTGKK